MTKFCFGQCGYDLYAEIHQNYYNQLIHGLFMPMLAFGVFMGLPALFNQSSRAFQRQTCAVAQSQTVLAQAYLYIAYLMYYLSFDPLGAVMTAIIYAFPLYLATTKIYYPWQRWRDVGIGLMWVFLAVIIQEVFGHTLFEQINSDLWQVPNSILIAPLFGARCLLHSV